MSNTPTAYLDILPPEVWLVCWTLCSTRQLRRVALVCQLFRSICLPLLLQHQRFDGWTLVDSINRYNSIDRARDFHRTAIRLDRLAQPSRVHLVRGWHFVIPPLSPSQCHPSVPHIYVCNGIFHRIVATFSATLGLYHNLRSLHIQGLTIDTPLRDTLLSLSMLEELTISSCDIVTRDGDLMELASFTISGVGKELGKHATSPLQLVSPEHLRKLAIHSTFEISHLITGLGPGRLPLLVDLSLHDLFNVDAVFRFLEQCPQLESLEIISIPAHLVQFLPTSLDRNVIPRLENLLGPPEVLGLLTTNRPVSAVTVRSPPRRRNLASTLKHIVHASVPLRSLATRRVSPSTDFDLLACITSLFPDLRELSMDVMESPSRVKKAPTRPATEADRVIGPEPPDLHDDHAFDDLPPEDVSDAEDAEALAVVLIRKPFQPEMPMYSNIEDVLTQICRGDAVLPPYIEVLRLQIDSNRVISFSLEQQHQLVAELSRRYPQLDEVQIGYPRNNWKRMDGTWRAGVNS
ncbi:hypothetical protein C8R44DRAFT_767203 [Mycena epipterygia]|nr:hypothetical protein C8R44DRAFT_767203 [Mycena epipterygia]